MLQGLRTAPGAGPTRLKPMDGLSRVYSHALPAEHGTNPFPVPARVVPSAPPYGSPLAQAFLVGVSVFSIVNPFAAIPVFVGMTSGLPDLTRRRLPRQTAFACFLILSSAYLVGKGLLAFFGISISSLRVAGGILIFSMAWSMLQARMHSAKQTPEEAKEAEQSDSESIAVVPLAMPLMAGPGSISVMILTATQTQGLMAHGATISAVAVVCILIYVILLLAEPIAKMLGRTGMNVATRFMGLILAAVAIEFITGGLSELFPAWTVTGVGG